MARKVNDEVATAAPWWEEQRYRWRMARDLLGGTEAMREAGEVYLPRFPQEEAEVFAARLGRATLNNFYRRTVKEALGLIFAKPVMVVGSRIPEVILGDIDQKGRTVSEFARMIAGPMLTRGMHHAFVDAPNPGKTPESLADDLELNLRPYWGAVSAESCIDAYCALTGGRERITHVRYLDPVTDRQGFSAVVTERIRVFEEREDGIWWQLWAKVVRKDARNRESEQWELQSEGMMPERVREVSWTTFYAERAGFMRGVSPVSDVAYKAVEHWQSSADQRNILTVSRYPIQYQIGTEEPVSVTGPYKALHSKGREGGEAQDVSFGYIEPACTGVQAGERDLDRIEKEAEALGRQLRVRAARVRMAAAQDAAEAASPLQEFASHLEDGLNEMLRHTAMWLGLDPEDAGHCVVNRDFGVSAEDDVAVNALLQMRGAGDISRKSLLAAMKEKGVLEPDFDIEAEDRLIGEELPEPMEDREPGGFGIGPDDERAP